MSSDPNSGGPEQGFLVPLRGPELVIGLIGPIGTDMKMIFDRLAEELKKVRYDSQHIHVTDSLNDFDEDFGTVVKPVEKRYETFINAGNKLRERLDRQDAFALMAVAAIRERRKAITGSEVKPAPYTAYVVNQFKRPEEVVTLRSVYGRAFFQLSAFCPKALRLKALTKRIRESHAKDKSDAFYEGAAADLIARDDSEEEQHWGQRVRDAFPLADVVIDCSDKIATGKSCERFVQTIFGNPFVSPSPDEQGMYLARCAALRSADLSRQVGAAITNDDHDLLSIGCNEVPRIGGGAHWQPDTGVDRRDFALGYDPSSQAKRDLVTDLLRRLQEGGWLADEFSGVDPAQLSVKALNQTDGPIRDASVMNVLEFGRVVHAEMHAVGSATLRGVSLRNATLYCTTFPCHNCARQLIASGIRRVVYLEPYSKSMAIELYPDFIAATHTGEATSDKIRFEQFVGIGPERYLEIFAKSKRKDDDGNAVKWVASSSEPLLRRLVPSYLTIEQGVLASLANQLTKVGLKLRE